MVRDAFAATTVAHRPDYNEVPPALNSVPRAARHNMSTLAPAVSSLRSSLSLLNSSIAVLDDGVSDFPRLCTVLTTQQHFELVPETELREAQQSLVDEIAPAISQLLRTAEGCVGQAGRREESLKARFELLEGRLGNGRRASSFGGNGAGRAAAAVGGERIGEVKVEGEDRPLSEAQVQELKRLRQKKERLQYAVERLELQSKQRERELRKSMAVVRD